MFKYIRLHNICVAIKFKYDFVHFKLILNSAKTSQTIMLKGKKTEKNQCISNTNPKVPNVIDGVLTGLISGETWRAIISYELFAHLEVIDNNKGDIGHFQYNDSK